MYILWDAKSYSFELKNVHWVHYLHAAAYFAMKAVTPLMTTGICKLVSFTHIHFIVSYGDISEGNSPYNKKY